MTCFLVDTDAGAVMLDCGPTATVGLERVGRDPNAIGTIVVSHLHGDHFAGLVWLYIHALYVGQTNSAARGLGSARHRGALQGGG